MTIKLKEKIIDLNSPLVMGIINATPDSFYTKSRIKNEKQLIIQVQDHLENGASIIDIGGYSTRPGAKFIEETTELKRLCTSIEIILKEFPNAIISVDTFRSNIAKYIIEQFKIPIINDIGGGTLDSEMFNTISKHDVCYIMMHTRGTPSTMNNLTSYNNIHTDIFSFFESQISKLRNSGVKNIIIDPGFGFAKTLEQNYSILKNLNYFKELNTPILTGISRKSMIYKLLETTAEESLNGTTATHMLALMNGANILRVHDTKAAVETIKIYEQYSK